MVYGRWARSRQPHEFQTRLYFQELEEGWAPHLRAAAERPLVSIGVSKAARVKEGPQLRTGLESPLLTGTAEKSPYLRLRRNEEHQHRPASVKTGKRSAPQPARYSERRPLRLRLSPVRMRSSYSRCLAGKGEEHVGLPMPFSPVYFFSWTERSFLIPGHFMHN